jgi:hypothetical protein
MTGEDSPSSGNNQLAKVSDRPIRMKMFSVDNSISTSWHGVEARLRWALRSINVGNISHELKVWLDMTPKNRDKL